MLKRNCVLRVSKRRRCARYGRISRLTAAPYRSGRDLAAERAEIAGHGAENDVTTPSNIRVKITAAPGTTRARSGRSSTGQRRAPQK